MIYFFYLSAHRRKIIHGGFFVSFVFLFFIYLLGWLVGWLGLDSAVGMVWYGIGKCIAGFVVFIYLFYLFIYLLSKLCVVSYLSYIYFICLFFFLVRIIGGGGGGWMVVSLIIYLSPTCHTKLTLALDNLRMGRNTTV